MKKTIDITGLGACAVDLMTKVETFSDKDNKITADNLEFFGGGVTANNLVQAARLGLKVCWCGALGRDKCSKHLAKKFKRENIRVRCVKGKRAQTCWIIVDKHGEKQIYLFPNASKMLTPQIVDKKFKKSIIRARHFHTAIAAISIKVAIRGAEIAKKYNTHVLLDVDGDLNHFASDVKLGTINDMKRLIRMADVVKLSESAAKKLAGKKKIEVIIKDMLKHSKIVVMTLGKKGCIIASRKEMHRCPSFDVNCVDGTGAGDAFMGGLSYALLKKMPLKQAGMFANACGAFCCTKLGARGSGRIKDVKKILKQ